LETSSGELIELSFAEGIWAACVAGRWPSEGGLPASPACREEDSEAAEDNPDECAAEFDGEVRGLESSMVFSGLVSCELVEFVTEIVEAHRLRACAGDCERLRLSIMMSREWKCRAVE